MYVTRPLSLYRKEPSLLGMPTPEARSSGYMVTTDEESEADDTCCWGSCKDNRVRDFPFPQNKIMNIVYTSGGGENRRVERKKVWFIPVLDQPLSANRYYVIRATGQHKGQACTCSREEDMSACCFCNIVNDVKPRVLDHRDIYQQVEIFKSRGGFAAKSVAPDGFPPHFLRRKGWKVHISGSYHCQLGEALGLDVCLRMRRVPELNLPMSSKRSEAVVVGKWYCPFVFIMEGRLKDQMKNSLFYETTLEQTWEEIYACGNDNTAGNFVAVSVTLQKETTMLFGEEAMKDDTPGVDGFIWFRNVNRNEKGSRLGLNVAIVEKMRWYQENGGFIGGGERDVRVEKVEKFEGEDCWKRFRCFVLVERFVLRRMDGTSVLTCDYRHIHRIQSNWE